jgi:hypothetical protein
LTGCNAARRLQARHAETQGDDTMLNRTTLEASLFMLAIQRTARRPNPEYVAKLTNQVRKHIKAMRDFAAKQPDSWIADKMFNEASQIEDQL